MRRAGEVDELGRTSWASFFRPGVLARYLRLMIRGWRVRGPDKGDDLLQLGGDFVIDAAGKLAYAFRSEESTHRPSANTLLKAIRAVGSK